MATTMKHHAQIFWGQIPVRSELEKAALGWWAARDLRDINPDFFYRMEDRLIRAAIRYRPISPVSNRNK